MTPIDTAILAIIGLLCAATGGVAVHLYQQIGAVRDRIEVAFGGQIKDLWTEIRSMHEGIRVNEREAWASRERIAGEVAKLVTRDDLKEEMGRVVTEIDRRFCLHRRPRFGERENPDE